MKVRLPARRGSDTRIAGRVMAKSQIARAGSGGRRPRRRPRYAWTTMAFTRSEPDVQARVPQIAIGLSRVGLTGVEKVIQVGGQLFFARLECYVDLGREQKGAHMSRF